MRTFAAMVVFAIAFHELQAPAASSVVNVNLSQVPSPASDYYWVITKGRDPQSARAVYGLSPDGTTTTVIYEPNGLGPSQYISVPAVRADGRVVFHASTSEDCGPLCLGRLWTDELTALASSYADTPCGPIVWIPGTDEVLFSNFGSGIHRIDINPATSDESRLTADMFDEVVFVAPNGTVFFAGWRGGSRMHIMNINGTGIQDWDPLGDTSWAVPSPDGQMLAVQKVTGPWRGSITLTTPDGTPITSYPQPLTGDWTGSVGGLAWSQDGKVICFQRDMELWTIHIDDVGSLRQLTHGEYPFVQVWGAFTVTRTALGFNGFLPPIGGADATGGSFDSPVRTFKMNSTIPVKFASSCEGSPVLTGVHTLQVMKFSSATNGDAPIDATPSDAATAGNQFRLTGDEWHFNLNTKATGMSVGVWQLVATLSDGSQHYAWVQIK